MPLNVITGGLKMMTPGMTRWVYETFYGGFERKTYLAMPSEKVNLMFDKTMDVPRNMSTDDDLLAIYNGERYGMVYDDKYERCEDTLTLNIFIKNNGYRKKRLSCIRFDVYDENYLFVDSFYIQKGYKGSTIDLPYDFDPDSEGEICIAIGLNIMSKIVRLSDFPIFEEEFQKQNKRFYVTMSLVNNPYKKYCIDEHWEFNFNNPNVEFRRYNGYIK